MTFAKKLFKLFRTGFMVEIEEKVSARDKMF